MNNQIETLEPSWTGPYSWPKYESENATAPLPEHAGVYLLTAEHKLGYLIYAAGITRRDMSARFREHTREFLNGNYTVLDIDSMRDGLRNEVWHGWGWTEAKRIEFAKRREEIVAAANRQLAGFRIFAAEFPDRPRLIERVEAAVMAAVYELPAPLCDLADKGMHLAGRRKDETGIRLYNRRSAILYGLPDVLDV